MQTFNSLLNIWAYLLVLTSFILVRGQGQSCYFRDGSPAADDTPCSSLTDLPGAAVPCCGPGFSCLENRLCSRKNVDGSPNLSRGSCTDRSWQSVNCPQLCPLAEQGDQVNNCTFQLNITDSSRQVQFCCQYDKDCCYQPAALFTLGPWDFDTLSTMSPSSSATSTPSIASSSNAAVSSSSTATNDKGSSSSTRYKDIGIGVGIGVSVPLLSIAAVGLVWRRRRRHRHQNASAGLSRFTDSNQQIPPPFQERGHEEYADNIDRRFVEARPYELDSLKKPAELIGSEPDTRNLNVYTPRPLRPSSIGKQD